MTARRLFLRRVLGGLAASAAAPAVLQATQRSSPYFGHGPMAGPSEIQPDPIAQAALRQYERARHRAQVHRDTLQAKVGILDYDVAERRSWSSAFKAHVQAARAVARLDAEIAQEPVWEKLRKAVWGEL